MSQVQGGGAAKGRSKWLWVVAGGLAVAGLLYGAVTTFKSGASLQSLAKGEMAKLVVSDKPAPEPIIAQDAQGRTVRLSDLKGQVVVVNLWATWCAPCVKEMPTLAKLQSQYAGKPVKVLAISLDKGAEDLIKAKAFIADKAPLTFYHGDYGLAFALTPAAEGLPTTLIFDRSGREQARLAGGADWSTPEARAVIDHLLKSPA